ncbi:MAG: hypothetical protein ABI672_00830 [Vicinamibacteria bacterium]
MLTETRSVLAQDAAIPVLRAVMFFLGLLGSAAWVRLHRRGSWWLFVASCIAGLSFWLIQIQSPFGLGTDEALTRGWAQTGVNLFAPSDDGGFVWGTPAQVSLAATLARMGCGEAIVHAVPQGAAIICLLLLFAIPLVHFRDKTTAAFCSILVGLGGIYPGTTSFAASLLHPESALALGFLTLAIAWATRENGKPRGDVRGVAFISLSVVLALLRAGAAGPELMVAEVWILAGLSLLAASQARLWLEQTSASPQKQRGMEGAILLTVLSGSGLLWWTPTQTVKGFADARDPGVALRKPMAWILENVSPREVVLSSRAYSASISALAGRRVLFPPLTLAAPAEILPEPFRRNRLWETTLRGEPSQRLAEHFNATHLFLGPGEATPTPGSGGSRAEPALDLIPVYQDIEDFRIFRLTKK